MCSQDVEIILEKLLVMINIIGLRLFIAGLVESETGAERRAGSYPLMTDINYLGMNNNSWICINHPPRTGSRSGSYWDLLSSVTGRTYYNLAGWLYALEYTGLDTVLLEVCLLNMRYSPAQQ